MEPVRPPPCHRHVPDLTVHEFLNLGTTSLRHLHWWRRRILRRSDDTGGGSAATSVALATTTTTRPKHSSNDDGEASCDTAAILGLVWIHGSWTQSKTPPTAEQSASPSSSFYSSPRVVAALFHWLGQATNGLECRLLTAHLLLCEQTDPESYNLFFDQQPQQSLPDDLPALAVVACAPQRNDSSSSSSTFIRYLTKPPLSTTLMQLFLAWQQPSPQSVPKSHGRGIKMDTQLIAIADAVRVVVHELEDTLTLPLAAVRRSNPNSQTAATADDDDANDGGGCLRIFVAGDRSSVGKSSICLGILGTLLYHLGYTPQELAYIKPATQSEAMDQPIQVFCTAMGIRCVPIGPLVYYRGFTRAYLAGETMSTEQLLQQCANAVDRVARGDAKRVVIVDGVGFPAVGSICGTDNATMATVCGYPISSTATTNAYHRRPMGVVFVGGSGVGGAVDGYNLNATYFARANVPVLGAIFNKLSLTGYYALEECQKQVTLYFDQHHHQPNLLHHRTGEQYDSQRPPPLSDTDTTPTATATSSAPSTTPRPFGFVPVFPPLGSSGGTNRPPSLDTIREFITLFQSHVDVAGILQAAAVYHPNPTAVRSRLNRVSHLTAEALIHPATVPYKPHQQRRPPPTTAKQSQTSGTLTRPAKSIHTTPTNFGLSTITPQKRSREEIEQQAIHSGAAPSA